MGYQISYKDAENADDKAIEDLKDYLGPRRWAMIEGLSQEEGMTFEQINIALGFAGVQGTPVTAFGRKYMPESYRQWAEEEE
jgi:hypothetical protein